MKKLLMLMALAVLGFSTLGCAEKKPPTPVTKTEPAPMTDNTPAPTTDTAPPAAEEKK